MPVAEDSVRLDVGGRLRFNNLTLTRFKFDLPAGSITAPAGTVVPLNTTYNALSGEPRILAVDTIVADSGSLAITTFNRLPIPLTYTLTLNGFRSPAGAVLSQSSSVPAAPGNGSYSSSTITFSLIGVTIRPAAVNAGLVGSATLTGPINTVPAGGGTLADSAIIQSGTGSIVIRSLRGPLNPANTPELTVAIQDSTKLPALSGDFGDLKDETTVDSAKVTLTVVNTAQTPIVLSGFRLGAVQLDALDHLLRDGSGNPIYEKDAAGNPIYVSIADPGVTTFSVARASTKALTIAAGPFLDRVIDLLLDNKRVAVVASGSASVGDGNPSFIVRSDSLKVRFRLVASVSITIAAASAAPAGALAARDLPHESRVSLRPFPIISMVARDSRRERAL